MEVVVAEPDTIFCSKPCLTSCKHLPPPTCKCNISHRDSAPSDCSQIFAFDSPSVESIFQQFSEWHLEDHLRVLVQCSLEQHSGPPHPLSYEALVAMSNQNSAQLTQHCRSIDHDHASMNQFVVLPATVQACYKQNPNQ